MIKSNTEYLIKYEEYMRLLSILELAREYAKKIQRHCDASDVKNRLIELEAELNEYKKTNLS